MSKFKVGDIVWVTTEDEFGTIMDISELDDRLNLVQVHTKSYSIWMGEEELSFTKPLEASSKEEPKVKISDGGPSGYYDWPTEWNTLNDFIEDKSVKQWKGFSFHLGNIVKAVTRWGDKAGTTEEYDAKKIIYSGCRVLKMIIGKEKLREYLQSLLDDTQFK